MDFGRNAAFCVSVIGMGSMEPFCTRLPIQSCAPITRSGPVPACEAVTNCVCRLLAISSTLTGMPLSSVNFFETSVMIGAYRSSAQIVRAPSVLPAAAPPDVAAAVSPAAALLSAAPPPAALVVLGVDVELEPQA